MDKKIKKKWLKALRSGDYAQTEGNMCSIDRHTGEASYCCLGVLTEVMLGSDIWTECSTFAHHETLKPRGAKGYDGYDNDGFPPKIKVLRTAGLGIGNGATLVSMNDRGDTFEDIANWIETEL